MFKCLLRNTNSENTRVCDGTRFGVDLPLSDSVFFICSVDQNSMMPWHKFLLFSTLLQLYRFIIAIHFLVVNASSGLSFLWTNLTLSERVCIKEIIKINLTPKVSSELVKYKNLHQVRAENRQRKGGHFGCTASVVVLFASFFFRQFSFCCLTGHSQSFLMLVKTAHNYL